MSVIVPGTHTADSPSGLADAQPHLFHLYGIGGDTLEHDGHDAPQFDLIIEEIFPERHECHVRPRAIPRQLTQRTRGRIVESGW
jgi:hypothetical protein